MELVSSLPFIILFSHLFISIWTHGCLFCISCQNTILLLFLVPIYPVLATGAHFSQLLCSFKIAPSFFFFCTLLFCTTKCSSFILYIHCSNPQISHFSKELCFHSLEKSIRNRDVGAHCFCSVISFRCSQVTKQNICVYTNQCICTYL